MILETVIFLSFSCILLTYLESFCFPARLESRS